MATVESDSQTEAHLGEHETTFQHHMGKLTVTETVPIVITTLSGMGYPSDSTRQKLLAVPEHQSRFHEKILDSSDDRAAVIRAVSSAIRSTIHQGTASEVRQHTEGIEWGLAAVSLLTQASEMTDPETEQQQADTLRAAVVCSRFTEAPEDRRAFLKQLYETGLAEPAATACTDTELAIIAGWGHLDDLGAAQSRSTAFTPLKNLAPVFSVPTATALRYMTLQHNAGNPDKTLKPRLIQKNLAQQYAAGETISSEQEDEALRASVNDLKVAGEFIDVHKAERFALQQYFISEQARELFPDNDFANSPLARKLRAKAAEPTNVILETDLVAIPGTIIDPSAVNLLSTDDQLAIVEQTFRDIYDVVIQAGEAISELTAPVIERFKPPEGENGLDNPLSPQQRAATRYRVINHERQLHSQLAAFIDYDEIQRANSEFSGGSEIWSTSEEGAGATELMPDMLTVVILEARHLAELGDETITADQLYEATLQNRQLLVSLAAAHLSDLVVIADEALLPNSSSLENIVANEPHPSKLQLTRDENGKLAFVSDTPFHELTGQLESYLANKMGCPALRITVDGSKNQSLEDQAMYGAKNLVDHIVAAMFKEAQDRGQFDLNNYDPAGLVAAALEQRDIPQLR